MIRHSSGSYRGGGAQGARPPSWRRWKILSDRRHEPKPPPTTVWENHRFGTPPLGFSGWATGHSFCFYFAITLCETQLSAEDRSLMNKERKNWTRSFERNVQLDLYWVSAYFTWSDFKGSCYTSTFSSIIIMTTLKQFAEKISIGPSFSNKLTLKVHPKFYK